MNDSVRVGGIFTIECYDKDGNLKWRDKMRNLVVNEGLQHGLDVLFSGSAQTNPWYVGLTDASPTVAAGDTLASHVGWTEFDEYTGNRQEYVEVRTNQTMSNSASRASFPITASGTVGGAFLSSVATGTTGILLCASALTQGDRSVVNGDTVQVQYDYSAADDGV